MTLLQVLLSTLCLVSAILGDKSFPSDRDLSHVVRVGRNGRQVIHRQPGGQSRPGQVRKVVRKQRKGGSRARQERQFVAPVPAPLTFNIPPPLVP